MFSLKETTMLRQAVCEIDSQELLPRLCTYTTENQHFRLFMCSALLPVSYN